MVYSKIFVFWSEVFYAQDFVYSEKSWTLSFICEQGQLFMLLVTQKMLRSTSIIFVLRQKHTGPTVGHWKRLGRLGRGREQICLVCSAALEAFGAGRTLSALIQHVKSEEVGCQTSEPLDSLIGGVLANQRGVWEGRNTVCALFFYALCAVIPCFHVLEYWHETSSYVRSGRIKLCSFGNASLHV